MSSIFKDTKIGPYSLPASKMQTLFDEFKKLMPDFENFNSPGSKFLTNEIEYKQKALKRYQEEIGNQETKERIERNDGSALLSDISSRVGTNLVYYTSWRNTFGQDNDTITKRLGTIFQCAAGEYTGTEKIQPIFDAYKKLNTKPNWDAISTLLWAFNPREYFPIKISYFRKLATSIDIELPKGSMDAKKLSDVISFGKLIREALSPLNPKDWIDVQSFMWCVSPGSYTDAGVDYWVFQANPKYYDIEGALKNRVVRHWLAKQHKEELSPGDRVIIWVTGKNSGCYALAEINSDVHVCEDNADERKFSLDDSMFKEQDRVEISILHNFANRPVLWEALRAEKEFSDFKGGSQGTNFNATKAQFNKILNLSGVNMEHTEITSKDEAKIEEILKQSRNIILYGPPGTGKTFALLDEYFEKFTSRRKIKTKEEFIKSEVSKLGWFSCIALAMLDYENVRVPELITHPVIKYKAQLSSAKNIHAVCWGQLQKYTPLDCEYVNFTKRSEPAIFWKNKDSTWKIDKELIRETLPKIYSLWKKIKNYKATEAIERRYEFVTFHQSFSYEDFIEGIKPDLDSEADTNELSYIIEEGVFLRLAKKAALNPEESWALFIDEINRGNISNIFGELITLIEDDKRAGKKNELTVTLPYSKTEFSVPKNLYIIGTMNTADRSIEAIDSALRRRFSFVEIKPRPELLKDDNGEAIKIEGIDLVQLLRTINNRLLVLIGKDNLIGHSYFMNLDGFHGLQLAFKNKIIPLLEEYFYNDRAKIGMVLGDSFVKKRLSKENKITFAAGFENDELLDDTELHDIKDPLHASPDDFIRVYSKE